MPHSPTLIHTLQDTLRLEGLERALLLQVSLQAVEDRVALKFLLLAYPYICNLPEALTYLVESSQSA